MWAYVLSLLAKCLTKFLGLCRQYLIGLYMFILDRNETLFNKNHTQKMVLGKESGLKKYRLESLCLKSPKLNILFPFAFIRWYV